MSDDYTGVLLENIDHKLDALLESQDLMATAMQVKAIDKRLTRVEDDITVIRKVVTEESRVTRWHTKRLDEHESRITDLENDDLEYA